MIRFSTHNEEGDMAASGFSLQGAGGRRMVRFTRSREVSRAPVRSASGPLRRAIAIGVILATAVGFAAFTANAQDRSIVHRGDAVVTGFAGTVPPTGTLPPDVHPLDRTFINLNGFTAQVFDLSNLGGGPIGQVADAPVKFNVKAREIGHVFGLAFEGDGSSRPPNIFLSASSLFGLQLVKQHGGDVQRLLTGEPGARFMAGQFGPDRGGPGTIYKIDGRTGQISLFTDVQLEGRANSAPGLGNLAYDPRTKQIFASDLETGMIHRFTMDGRERDIYDHGVNGRPKAKLPAVAHDPAGRVGIENPNFNSEDTTTWGFAPKSRLVFGLAVQDRRLFYSVGEGPQIWSVGIDDEGDFVKDARLEIDVKDTPASNIVTAIKFDGGGMMYLAQRGEFTGSYDYQAFAKPQASVVLRYAFDEQQRRWTEVPEEYAIGLPVEHRATVGGIALNYGYDRNGRIDYGACRRTLWTTGEHLREGDDIKRVSTGGARTVHGLQGNYKSKVRPANEPPFESWFVDYDGRFDDADVNGHVGNIGIYNICEPGVQRVDTVEVPVLVPGDPNIVIEKRCFGTGHGGRVRCVITLRNTGGSVPLEDIVFLDDTRVLTGPGAGEPVLIAEFKQDGPGWTCSPAPIAAFTCRLTASELRPGSVRVIDVWVDTRDLLRNGNYGFRNCAIVKHRHGQGRACHEGGTDITVHKTGPAVCQPGGLCKYGITITNNGDQAFNGDLLLSDTLTNGGAVINAPITSIAPPLGCAVQPTQVPFSCVASVSLAAGESRTHWIDVQMPGGPGGYTVQNCFGVTDPWLVSDNTLLNRLLVPVKVGPTIRIGYQSCVRTRIPGRDIVPVPSGVNTLIPSDPVCWDGRVPGPGGSCACRIGTRWNPAKGACDYPRGCFDPARTMPNGQCCTWGSVWDSGSSTCRRPPQGCYDPARRTPNGDCCQSGTVYSWRTKSCNPPVTVCENGRPPLPNGLCGCPLGLRWDPVTRACGKPGQETGGRCPDGKPKGWGGVCACPEGSRWNIAAQSCLRIIVDTTCGLNQRRDAQTGKCEPVIMPIRCPLNAPFNAQTGKCERLGQVPGKDPVGACKEGWVKTTSGTCLPVSTQACPSGQVRVRGECVGNKTPLKCGLRQVVASGVCKDLPVRKLETKPDVKKKLEPRLKQLPNKVIEKRAVPKRVVTPKPPTKVDPPKKLVQPRP